MDWPEGIDHVTWRSRLRWGSAVGWSWLAMAASGRLNSGVEMRRSILLLGFTLPSPKSKNVGHPMNRRLARKPPVRSGGSDVPASADESKMSPKNAEPLSPVKLARYDGRTMLWPKR